MKTCTKCGCLNEDNANFCKKCGGNITENQVVEKKKEIMSKQKKYIAVAIFLILVTIIGVMIGNGTKKDKEYEGHIIVAEKYVEELNYEQAVEAYLEAIAIDPKQRKAYIELAEVYIKQNKPEKAKEILNQANEAGAKADEEEEEKENKIKNQLESGIIYSWIVDPTIEADDMYYVKTEGADYGWLYEESENNLHKQHMSEYVIIQKNGLVGMMDMQGNIFQDIKYKNIDRYFQNYFFHSTEPFYQYGYETDLGYLDENNEVSGVDGLGGPGIGTFCYNNDLYNTHDDLWGDDIVIPKNAMPVLNVKPEDAFELLYSNHNQKYALYKEDRLISDFIYDKCGSYSEGLLAVSQNGKWGYVNNNGEIVIPIEYDASWDKYDFLGYTQEPQFEEYCYAASNGYVTLCKNGQWELRTVDNKVAVPAGEFEKILPVFEGKCWVKYDGKWGVIELQKLGESEQVDLKKDLEKVINKDIFQYVETDYDGDGNTEAFAVTYTGEKYEGNNYLDIDIWFVNSKGNAELIASDLRGDIRDIISAGQQNFFLWENDSYATCSRTYVWGVKNGKVYELDISDKYMDFKMSGNGYSAIYDYYLDEGGHIYEDIWFAYDVENGQFYEK